MVTEIQYPWKETRTSVKISSIAISLVENSQHSPNDDAFFLEWTSDVWQLFWYDDGFYTNDLGLSNIALKFWGYSYVLQQKSY